jgi:hypothetical protein
MVVREVREESGFEVVPLSSNRTNERHLAEVAAHLQDPARPAAFD